MSSPSSDRRDFLKAAAATGAAAAAFSPGVYAAGGDKIKVGVIGCGGRGNGAIRNILDADKNVEIVAFGDVFPGQAKGSFNNWKKNKEHGARVTATEDTVFDGLDAYKKVLAAGIDLVILATPPGFRPLHLEAAVKAKKHIFCEKPVAVDAAGIRKCLALVEESKKAGIAIVAGTQRRHQKGYIETINKIKDGAIGDVITARVAWNGTGIWFHKRRDGETDAQYQIRNWYHFLWVCGDHIVEQHVHNLDVANWVMGDHPIRATGLGGRSSRPGGVTGAPNEFGNIWDHYAVEYEYKSGQRVFSYCKHIPGCETDVSETVFGSKGISRVNAYTINKEKVGEDGRDAYVQEHIDLLASIRSGKYLNELQTVTESTFTAILGRNASYAQKWIKWDDALAANEDTMPHDLTLQSAIAVPPAPTPGSWKLPARGA